MFSYNGSVHQDFNIPSLIMFFLLVTNVAHYICVTVHCSCSSKICLTVPYFYAETLNSLLASLNIITILDNHLGTVVCSSIICPNIPYFVAKLQTRLVCWLCWTGSVAKKELLLEVFNTEWTCVLLQLMDMGFSREHATDALMNTHSLEQATEYCLTHQQMVPAAQVSLLPWQLFLPCRFVF